MPEPRPTRHGGPCWIEVPMNPEKLNDALVVMAYLDGEATAQERVHAERLLAEDPEVRDLVEELRATSAPLRDVPKLSLGPDFATQVLAGLPEVPAREAPGSNSTTITLRSATSHVNVQRWLLLVSSLAAVCLVMALVFPIPNQRDVAHFDTAGPAARQADRTADVEEAALATSETVREWEGEFARPNAANPLAGVAAPAESSPAAASAINGVELEMAEPSSRPRPAPLRDRIPGGGSRMMVAPEATPAMEAPAPVAPPTAPAPVMVPEAEMVPARGMMADSVPEDARSGATGRILAGAAAADEAQVPERPLVVYLDVAADGQAERHFQGLLVQNAITLQVSHKKRQQVAEVYYNALPVEEDAAEGQVGPSGQNRFYAMDNVQQVLPSEPREVAETDGDQTANARNELRRAIQSTLPADNQAEAYALPKELLADVVVPSEGVLVEASAEQIEQLLVDLADQPNLYLACSLVQADGVLLKDSDRSRVLKEYGVFPGYGGGAASGLTPASPRVDSQDDRGTAASRAGTPESQSAGERPLATNGPATADGAGLADQEVTDRMARDKNEEKTKVDDQAEYSATQQRANGEQAGNQDLSPGEEAQAKAELGAYAQRVTVEAEEPARQLMQQQALFNDYNRAQYRKSRVADSSQQQTQKFGGQKPTNSKEPALQTADAPVTEPAPPAEAEPGQTFATDEEAMRRRAAQERKQDVQRYGETLPQGKRVQVLFLLRSVADDPLLANEVPMTTKPPVAGEVQPAMEAAPAIEAGPSDGR